MPPNLLSQTHSPAFKPMSTRSKSSIPTASIDRARQILQNAVAPQRAAIGDTHVASAIQAIIWQDGALKLNFAGGQRYFSSADLPVTPDTPMDIASLTKPLVTATLLMQAVDAGLANFDDPISKHLPQWKNGAHARDSATLLHLLNHSSGLPAWDRFYLRYPLNPTPTLAKMTRAAIMESIANTPLQARPGMRHCYSDLGYLLLGHLIEHIFGAPLHTLADARIFGPLGMTKTRYVASCAGDLPLDRAAATEDCSLRGRLVIGTVHDENTEIIGGVAGHAGVFSTAGDLLEFCAHLLAIDRGTLAEPGIISRETLQLCLSEQARSAGNTAHPGHHLGGWDTPSGPATSAGEGFRRGNTIGHLGFTGTSIWLERDLGIIAILLSNRVYPTRENQLIKGLRVAFHEAILPG